MRFLLYQLHITNSVVVKVILSDGSDCKLVLLASQPY